MSDFLKGMKSFPSQDKDNNNGANEQIPYSQENVIDKNEHRKEGHLYLVTEDRLGEVYLWDFTDKPKHEFKEVFSSDDLLNVAKEGAMLQYKNGNYSLYSADGYDMLFDEENCEQI